jgi:hypothetical protein
LTVRGGVWQVDVTHKLIMTSLLGFFPQSAQLPVALFVCLAYLVVILLRQPCTCCSLLLLLPFPAHAFLSRALDTEQQNARLHLLAQTDLLIMLIAGHVFREGQYLDSAADALASTFLILTLLAFLALFLRQLFLVIRLILFPKLIATTASLRQHPCFAQVDCTCLSRCRSCC